MLGPIIAKALSYIFNLWFEEGCFRNALKVSVITPIYKAGDRTLINNYRAISVLNNIAKILDKCENQALEHLNYNKIISVNQNDFKEGISTDDSMYEGVETIYNWVDCKKEQIAIFLDLAKTFDTVSHVILITQLKDYGIKGIANDLFSSYLQDGEQCVKIGESRSNSRKIKYGMTQGTVLGSVILIYILTSYFICRLMENCGLC